MRILDKYLNKHILHAYFFLLACFTGLFFLIDVFSNLADFLEVKPPFFVLVDYYLYMIPYIFWWVSPLSLLISVLYTFGELNKNNEIISMRASGISVLRLAGSALFFALLLSVTALFVQEKLLTVSQKKVNDIKVRYIKQDYEKVGEEKNIAFHSDDKIIFAARFSPRHQALYDTIVFFEDRNGAILTKMVCKTIVYQDGRWHARGVIQYDLDKKGNIIDTPTHWEERPIDLNEKPHELVYKKSMYAQFASLATLRHEMKRLKKIKAISFLNNLTIDYHNKLASPFSHFFMIIGILPIALEIKKRKVALSSLGVGLLFGFTYYCLSSLSLALGKGGLILPVLAAWIAPIFFVTVGLTGLALIK